jgi:hypothetical protein
MGSRHLEKLTGGAEGSSIPSDDYEQVDRLIRYLRSQDYFGKITISFEKGRVVHVKKEDSLSLRQRDIDRLTSEL